MQTEVYFKKIHSGVIKKLQVVQYAIYRIGIWHNDYDPSYHFFRKIGHWLTISRLILKIGIRSLRFVINKLQKTVTVIGNQVYIDVFILSLVKDISLIHRMFPPIASLTMPFSARLWFCGEMYIRK